jgi:tetratricopeptide (TPR) repeat protein
MGRNVQGLDYIEKSDQIMRALVTAAPENKQQQGIFAAIVATNGITLGNLHKLDVALKDLREARTYFERLEKPNSPNREIPIRALTCTEKMGEAASHAGSFKLAAEYFKQVLNQVEPELAKQNADPNVPYLTADSYSGLGDLELQRARQSHDTAKRQESWTQARAWYLKSLDAWRRIEQPLPVAPSGFDVGNPSMVKRNLELCEVALRGAKHSENTH